MKLHTLGFIFCALALSVIPSSAATDKPNIVLIVADDLGYADLGIQGCKDIATPHMDSIAADGVRFTDAYVTAPVCAPSRAGLLTGRWQDRFGFEGNPEPGATWGLPLTEKTIAERLKPLGYATGIFGKWHQGETPEFRPNKRGFDEFFGFLSGMHSYFEGNDPKWGPIFRGNEPVQLDKYLTQAIAEESVGFIDRHKGHPFFLYAAFNAPHTPMEAPQSYLDEVAGIQDPARRKYAAMVRALDDGVGTILEAIRKNGLEGNTLLIFLSDNGGPILEGAAVNGSSNAPLRGGKAEVWEGGIRVPFFVRWPGHLSPGKVLDDPVISLDILPTALALAGGPRDPGLDGADIFPWLEGKASAPARTTFFWKFYAQVAVRDGDSKLVRPNAGKPMELYDLKNDVSESRNLADGDQDRVKSLKKKFDDWNSGNGKPLNTR
ncbi:MAG: sulfatase [Verrucomicrobiaceae bacterium]|nr:MAG: sulfatase [Verrucomicrobiaceae bacterium]